MTPRLAIVGADVFDGDQRHQEKALLIADGMVEAIVNLNEVPTHFEKVEVAGGLITPAYIDLQANGGGGVLFNDEPTLGSIRTICETHAQFGTLGLLPTLITDEAYVLTEAIAAGAAAWRERVPGFLGLHLEGPHMCPEKCGVHDPNLIRVMGQGDLNQLIAAKQKLPNLMITVSPLAVAPEQISALTEAGIKVSLGHSIANYQQVELATKAGACCITHLFNAMSALKHRDPGMVGAALNLGGVFAGVIADGLHVDPIAISIALKAKQGPGKLFLVSDSMSTIGSNVKQFYLNGRTITRRESQLTLDDGTLAGAHLELHSAVLFMMEKVGLSYDECVRMASVYPAQCLGLPIGTGMLKPGSPANIIHVDDDNHITKTWRSGMDG